jgi:CRP-like cAMP-binding protein
MTHPSMMQDLSRQREAELKPRGMSRRDVLAGALRTTPLFKYSSERSLKAVAKQAKDVKVSAGTTVMTEGERGDKFYVVLNGQVRVSRKGRKVAELGPGKSFGELALLADQPRNATVVAMGDAELACFDRKTFGKLLDGAPEFSRTLLEGMAKRLRELDARAVN